MFNIPLKWRIFWFFLIFGLIPLIVVSYFSVDAYTRYVESMTEKHVTEIVQRIADQTDTFCAYIKKDLGRLARLPYVQLFFQEYLTAPRMSLIQEKLEHFRSNSTYFSRISLYSNEGRPMVGTPLLHPGLIEILPVKEIITDAEDCIFYREDLPEQLMREIIIVRKVRSFRDETHMVGYLAAHVALRHFIVYMDQLNIGEEIDKFIIAPDQRQIMIQKTTGRTSLHAKAASRAYRAAVPSMNWQIALRIPEKVLFEDVHHLLSRSISFILLVVAFAIAASLVFSRRITRPLAQVIQGTKEFAANNLEYRIDLKSGYEGKQLADAFNTMADQLQKRQQELIRYNKLAALGLLSAGIAHEVKNPLAGIKTSSQVVTGLLADSVKTSEKAGAKTRDAHNIVTIKASEYSDIINILIDVISEVDRLDKIATDLLDFGRPWDSNRIQCDLSDITKRTLHLLRKELGQKRVKVVNNVTNAAAYVDPDQIMQVFVNLILNAIEAVEPDTGVIRITSKSRNTGETQFQVADNGHGIPEAKINRLFDPFFTLTSHGTGLGLSVVYTLLKQNSVHMDVHSRLNEGTVFTLTFSPNCPM